MWRDIETTTNSLSSATRKWSSQRLGNRSLDLTSWCCIFAQKLSSFPQQDQLSSRFKRQKEKAKTWFKICKKMQYHFVNNLQNFRTNADEFHLRELNFDAHNLLLMFHDIATFTTNVYAVWLNTHETHNLRNNWAPRWNFNVLTILNAHWLLLLLPLDECERQWFIISTFDSTVTVILNVKFHTVSNSQGDLHSSSCHVTFSAIIRMEKCDSFIWRNMINRQKNFTFLNSD